MPDQFPHQNQPVYQAGQPLDQAGGAMILMHGRGATAPSILELASLLPHDRLAYLAPQAADQTWYPFSFMESVEQNEPGLSSGLQVLADLISQIEAAGIPAERIIIGGFSQGGCLVAEFAARHPRQYGGLLIFSGGLIGPPGSLRNYSGSLNGMLVFLGCSATDFHIPATRVDESAVVFEKLGGTVTKQLYQNMGHTIIQAEIEQGQKIVEAVMTGVC
jgi:predicted esterase